MSMKNPLTPAGIEPATIRFVAQHLNHCATAESWITGTWYKDRCILTLISRSVILRMRYISDGRCKNNRNTHFKYNCFFFRKLVAFMRYCGQNMVQPDRPLMATQYDACALHARQLRQEYRHTHIHTHTHTHTHTHSHTHTLTHTHTHNITEL